ncbi:MAG: hypothetical protein Q8Q09_05495 [Deltaproteobacteria bacterium]|nr:hypothetical protein [Deltaproteobacteria bacterium]
MNTPRDPRAPQRALISTLLLSLVSSAPLSCGETQTQYLALDRDFQGFLQWPQRALGSTTIAGHPAGPRVLYRRPNDQLPPWAGPSPDAGDDAGPPQFARGTILVKTVEVGPVTDWEIFAMVKRGGDYNHNGAVGWEFFSLKVLPSGAVIVVGRGLIPSADRYTDPGTGQALTCNQCHGTTAARARDSVLSEGLTP